jgi:hypothetical protein|tara:strand:- start:1419 stop:1664 length:246 start_codon:yes stop_codon:yes gene_type:complete
MYRTYIRKNITSVAIILFIIIFAIIQVIEPAFLYEKDGSLRQFGLGSSKKTIIPIWFLTLILSMMCYLLVLYYIAAPKLKF